MTVEAHESKLVVFMGGAPTDSYPYSAVHWFRVSPLPEGLRASEHLGVGIEAVWMSLTAWGEQDRWRLVVKPDDLVRWQTILAHFGIRDAEQNRAG